MPREQAEVHEKQAMATYDLWVWLMSEVRQAVEPLTPAGRMAAVSEVEAMVRTAAELLMTLNHAQITAFAHKLLERWRALVVPLAWLEQCLAPWRKHLDATTEAAIVLAWQYRHTLSLEVSEGFSATLQTVVRAF